MESKLSNVCRHVFRRLTNSGHKESRTGPLRVAMIGQKGVPATFGGIERHVEELGARMSAQGAEITVYCRRSYTDEVPDSYRGLRLVVTPTVASKHLDAIVHSVTSTLHALISGADVVHYHALGPGLAAPLSRLAGAKVALTVHGLDQERAKWSGLARRVLGTAYWMSGHVPDAVITVSKALAQRYIDDFSFTPTYIPNGVAPAYRGEPLGRLASEFDLQPGQYALFVGRLVPEKRPELLVDAARHLPEGCKVVLVGDSSFSDDYVNRLRAAASADDRVVLPGYLYGSDLAAVLENAGVFVQPSDLEGLPLTLLEALSYGLPTVVSDISPHLEIVGTCQCSGHRTFPTGDADALGREMADLFNLSADDRKAIATDCEHLLVPYNWDTAAEQLLDLYHSLVRGSVLPSTAHTLQDR
ncbi:Glycosyltransferase involved in cell wall bisynthesis [Ruaniaceae bacterium KH17]|nr:Glycosyltransferase involved in cell wall bisynthesis [Ruaniaceae bacterium KH17]